MWVGGMFRIAVEQ